MDITYLHECFDYNEHTGELIAKKGSAKRPKGSVCGWKHSSGHIRVGVGKDQIYAHRICWAMYHGTDIPDGMQVDHINGIRDDNRISNLRIVTQTQNSRNMRKRDNNRSGVTGVKELKNKKWEARIMVSYQTYVLGSFEDKFDAICARKSAEVVHGFSPGHGRAA